MQLVNGEVECYVSSSDPQEKKRGHNQSVAGWPRLKDLPVSRPVSYQPKKRSNPNDEDDTITWSVAQRKSGTIWQVLYLQARLHAIPNYSPLVYMFPISTFLTLHFISPFRSIGYHLCGEHY